jgi:tRNA dimethylallyltransferase
MPATALRGVAIMGATGVGKSELAIALADEFQGEIISMDSRQVYRGLDIGTAKVGEKERRHTPHHLIDFLEPVQTHSAGRHCELVKTTARDILSRGAMPFLVGGTGFYFRALYQGLIEASVAEGELQEVRQQLERRDTDDLYRELEQVDAVRAKQVSTNDRVRIMRALEIYRTTGTPPSEHAASQPAAKPWDGPRLVLTMPRDALRARIAKRTEAMYAQGWVAEVQRLLDAGVPADAPAMKSLGYGLIAESIQRGEDPQGTIAAVTTQTQQYAKRQETFFRAIDKAQWVDVTAPDAVSTVQRAIRRGLAL